MLAASVIISITSIHLKLAEEPPEMYSTVTCNTKITPEKWLL